MVGVLSLAAGLPAMASGFLDDFESGLGQWTGKAGGVNHGIIVTDPLASGRSNVLSFTGVGYGGDLFSTAPISLTGPAVISFDYLGLAQPDSHPGDLGGFLGIAYSLNPKTEGTDIIWYAGTIDSYPGLLISLADDGLWHHYQIPVNATALGTFRLTVEDFSGSGNNGCDVYFDNISVTSLTAVPEPTSLSLAVAGAIALIARRRCQR